MVATVETFVDTASPGAAKTVRGDVSTEKSSGAPVSPNGTRAMRHASSAFDHVDCIANVPFANETFCTRPGPLVRHVHLSAFSSPSLSSHPLDGSWSVSVSENSCPSTIDTPSRTPALPGFTKFSPHD